MSLSEARFHDLVDATQQALEDLFDESGLDLDMENSGGVLTVSGGENYPAFFLVLAVLALTAASAAFATPFGYQTNVLVYQMGGYSYLDFVRVGLPLNLITWAAAMVAIPIFFPF